MADAPLTLAELARRLGHDPDWIYRRGRLAALLAEGLPAPLSGIGRPRFDRASVEAWLGRHHPLQPKAIANDQAPPPVPANDAAWRGRLATAYGRKE